MLDTLKLKYFQGKQYIPNIKNAPMREQFRGLPIIKNGTIDEAPAPAGWKELVSSPESPHQAIPCAYRCQRNRSKA